MEFRFIREGDVFAWQNDSYRLAFSEPFIQPWNDENKKIYSEEEILFYYYNLDTYRKNGAEWEKISGIRAFDFPAIFRLLEVVEYVLNYEPDDDIQPDKPSHDGVSEEYDTNYWVREDYYSVRSFKDVCGERHFEVYAGTSQKGIRALVNEWELYELQKCAEAFVQFSIEHSNEFLNRRNNSYCASHKAKNGKLYEYEMDFSGDDIKIDYSSIEEIFIVGDKIEDIAVLVREGEHFYTDRGMHKVIAEITDEKLIFTDGSTARTDRIIHIFRDVSDEELAYDIQRVTEDFLSVLDDDEKADFAALSEDALFHKYGGAISGRTHLYRREHDLPMVVEGDDNHENVRETVRMIIRDIKRRDGGLQISE